MSRWLDFIFLLRPSLLLPVWIFIFLGLHWGSGHALFGFDCPSSPRFWLIFISYSLLLGWVYVLNQIFDIESDRINEKLFLLPSGIISLREAWIFSFCALIASFLLAMQVGISFLVLWVFSLIMGYMYSGPPFRLKDRPVLDVFANSLGYGCVNFLVGWITVRPVSSAAFPHAGLYFMAVAAVFLNTTIPDIPGDKAAQKVTTGVLLGRKYTTILSALLFFMAFFLSLRLTDFVTSIASMTGLILSVLSAFRRDDLLPKLSYRIPAGIFALFVSLRYPPLLLLSIVTLVGMRVYYKRRFGLAYPSVTGR